MSELLTTTQFLTETGVTYRVLDYWIRNGVFEPAVEASGSGSRRQFFPEQVMLVRTLARVQTALNRNQFGVSTVLLGEVCDAIEQGAKFIRLDEGVWLTWEVEP